MSPDPPRDDSGDDDDRIRRFSGEFIEGVMDEEFFIVPDAPYELDMDVESDYTDSEEEEHRGAGGASSSGRMSGRTATSVNINLEGVSGEEEFSFQGQGRGRYRLLIPFPTPTTSSASDAAVSSTENSEIPAETSEISSINQTSTSQRAEGDCDQSPDANQLSPVKAEEIKPASTENEGSKDEDSSKKREIEMSEEKVETIKEVMKNITLPSAAIPKWASELDEDIWKRKLYDSLGNKSSPKPSSSVHHHKQEETIKLEGGSNSSNSS